MMRRALIPLLLILLCLAGPVRAMDVGDSGFGKIPVLHEGRVKPLDSFARTFYWRLTGSQAPHGQDIDSWLAGIIFDPVNASEMPQFAVRDRNLRAMLGLPDNRGDLYSFAEIIEALAPHMQEIEALSRRTDLTPTQEALMTLQVNVRDYMQLMRSLSLLLPLAVTVPAALKPEDGTATDYMALRKYEERAQNRLKAIIKQKGEDVSKYTDEEKDIAAFSFQLSVISSAADGNNFLRVIPPQWNGAEWLSPWAVIQRGQGSPETAKILDQWKAMATAWDNGNAAAFAASVKSLRHDTPQITAEVAFNRTGPFNIAICLYLLALTLAVAALRWPRAQGPAILILCAGAATHVAGMALRIFILGRPPVGTLYESLLFVSLVCVGATVLFARRNPPLLAAGALAGTILLEMAPFLVRNGDTLPVLVAVLNTNFWLATHVVIITGGYGFSLLCALAAHIWLVGNAMGKIPSMGLTHRLALIALLLTAVGTILGGIWADQSWGRFWGWDPKENGALLIVLWLIWALHGRRAGKLPPLLYAMALAATNVVVALAWFGVNLLSVGLHSYGFTSGIATALASFCATEALIIGLLWWRCRTRSIRHAS